MDRFMLFTSGRDKPGIRQTDFIFTVYIRDYVYKNRNIQIMTK